MSFPFFRQHDSRDCGPTCLRMITKFYGRNVPVQTIREATQIGKDGVSLLGISDAAEKIGFKTLAVKVTLEKLLKDAVMPCIVHWDQNHFVVVTKGDYRVPGGSLKRNRKGRLVIADPASGIIEYTYEEFESKWASDLVDGEKTGVALLLEPSPRFYEDSDDKSPGLSFGILSGYIFKYKRLILQLFFGLIITSSLQLFLPFLTQSMVDIGIRTRNLHFIYLVLAAQLMLFLGRTSVEFIRSWILLHISTRISLSILSDFLSKLLRLPIPFFDSKNTGDILQRIRDQNRIESFLTGTSINVIFSLFNLVIFSFVLAYYNFTIFGIYLFSSVIYGIWIVFFLRYRRKLDNKRFALGSRSQSSLIELVQSVPELKLNNAEIKKRWEWENIQVKSFHLSVRSLALQQYQQTGATLINEGKNIIISFIAATAVVNGQMTLGAMMAMQYIIGQLNSPIEQLIQLMQHYQDAQISLERLNEIYSIDDEDSGKQLINRVGSKGEDIHIKDLTFVYAGAGNEPVLKNINMTIPHGKITAIVGTSGSGKTTLLKLLLKFYKAQRGEIRLANTSFENISSQQWRSRCGTVMQEGVIFSDTIAENIAISDDIPDIERLINSAEVANIQTFVEDLPLGYNTRIGSEGNGISQGQKQRILIARAVYKNPDYIFFDEATNALDANNEKIIMNNLERFFKGKTVVVVAHRLSTVKNADQIIVLENGEIVETGNHKTLTSLGGKYYELVKNQLELGN